MWWGNGFGWGWMLFGGFMMLLFWGGLIALVILAVRAISSSGSEASTGLSTGTQKTALDIVKERYARGEISKAEYEEMRRDLGI